MWYIVKRKEKRMMCVVGRSFLAETTASKDTRHSNNSDD